MSKPIIKILRDRRIELGWSQQTLADKLEKSQMAIWSWEAGRVDPRAHSLQIWARALGIRLVAEVDPEFDPVNGVPVELP